MVNGTHDTNWRSEKRCCAVPCWAKVKNACSAKVDFHGVANKRKDGSSTRGGAMHGSDSESVSQQHVSSGGGGGMGSENQKTGTFP